MEKKETLSYDEMVGSLFQIHHEYVWKIEEIKYLIMHNVHKLLLNIKVNLDFFQCLLENCLIGLLISQTLACFYPCFPSVL